MKYLFIKTRRDLIKMWTQFLSVFFMALIGVLIYVGMEGAWYGLEVVTNKYYEETNLASAWIYGMGFNQEDVNEICDMEGVLESSALMTQNVSMKTYTKIKPSIKLLATGENTISVPQIIEGEDFDYTSSGIWISKSFAEERNIQVNDTITLTYENKEYIGLVKGLIINPEFAYYTGSNTSYTSDYYKYGYAMIGENAAKVFFGEVINNQIKVTLDDAVDHKEFNENIKNILGNRYFGYADRDSLATVSGPINKVSQVKKMSILFSAVFILLVILTMQTTMTRLVENQRIQIGTFKALGFYDRQIVMHYSLYGLLIGLFGGVLALLIAPHTISYVIINAITKFYDIPKVESMITPYSYMVLAIVVMCCVLAAIFACKKSLEEMPAETLRGAIPKSGKKILLEKMNWIWKHVSFGWKWSMRDIARNKVKTIMGIIGVFGCMMLLIASFGMKNSLDYANDYVFHTEYTYEARINLQSNVTDEDREELFHEIGEGQWLFENSMDIKAKGIEKKGIISIVDEGDYIFVENMDQKQIVLQMDGVYITRKIAEQLNVVAGDAIKIRMTGEQEYITLSIADIISAPSPQGLFISAKQWQKLGKSFHPNVLLVGSSLTDDIKELNYISETTTIGEQYEGAKNISESVSMIFTLLKLAAIVLGVVILYNLGILSYTERTREYATLKVLGFYQKEIRSFALRENLLITVVGWMIGIPIGFAFLTMYVRLVSSDNYDWVAKLTLFSFVISTVITVGCSIGVSLFLNQKVKKINMVEALKSVE